MSPRPSSTPRQSLRQTMLLIVVVLLGLLVVTLAVVVFRPAQPLPGLPTVSAQPGASATVVLLSGETPSPPPADLPAATLPDGCIQRGGRVLHGRVTQVVDAQRLEINVAGQIVVVRLAGIRAPQSAALQENALQRIAASVRAEDVTVIEDALGVDAAGVVPGYILSDRGFLNADLVAEGLAAVDAQNPALGCASFLGQIEQQARAAHRGIWQAAPVPTRTFLPTVALDSSTAPCACSTRPTCAEFTTQAQAQACFNACNDYNTKLDDDHNGVACEELP